jgi:hypothetical protein
MKVLCFYILFQLAIPLTRAETGHLPEPPASAENIKAVTNVKSTTGTTQFNFHNHNSNYSSKDSFLIIYDRYDRSGAGIIHKIFYPSVDHTISVAGIPPGKYFITIQGLGIHRKRFEKVIRIKSRKSENVAIKLEDCDEFTKDNVVIPAEYTDFANLKIMAMK